MCVVYLCYFYFPSCFRETSYFSSSTLRTMSVINSLRRSRCVDDTWRTTDGPTSTTNAYKLDQQKWATWAFDNVAATFLRANIPYRNCSLIVDTHLLEFSLRVIFALGYAKVPGNASSKEKKQHWERTVLGRQAIIPVRIMHASVAWIRGSR